jgi:hypothetical protein
MILRFKKGSKLEKEVTRLYELRERTHKQTLDIIERFSGVRPEGMGFFFVFQYTCNWSIDMLRFSDDFKSPNNIVIPNKKEKGLFMINRRTKAYREILKECDNLEKVSGDGIIKLGIPVMTEACYSFWKPCKDEKGVFLNVANCVIDRMKTLPTDTFISLD